MTKPTPAISRSASAAASDRRRCRGALAGAIASLTSADATRSRGRSELRPRPWVDSATVSAEQLTQQQPSLYRRHRPRTFAEVVGQEHVVRTLRNAVERGKVHHAYLFVGSRGTGKTSMAKILAACLNCERRADGRAVRRMRLVRRRSRARRSLDVIEMDAASNNSVDDIRELRESVAFAPVCGRSQGLHPRRGAHALAAAWNAFLKTLEEPPPNTVFVLATTEAQQGAADGRRPLPPLRLPRARPSSRSRRRAARVARAGVDRDPARRASRCSPVTRPAPSATRSARSSSSSPTRGSEIAPTDVLAVLGVADADVLFGASTRSPRATPRRRSRLRRTAPRPGRDAASFARDLEVHARELLVVQTLGGVPAELR